MARYRIVSLLYRHGAPRYMAKKRNWWSFVWRELHAYVHMDTNCEHYETIASAQRAIDEDRSARVVVVVVENA